MVLSVDIAAVVDEGVEVGSELTTELVVRPVLDNARVGRDDVDIGSAVAVVDDCCADIPFVMLSSKVNVLARRRPRRSEFVVYENEKKLSPRPMRI